MKVFLATTSEFKNKLLDIVHIKHYKIDSDFDEKKIVCNDVYEYVKSLSLGKASSVIDKVDNSIIIGLDTIVYVDGEILEKPKDINEAKRYIEKCKNNTTSVITGICIINKYTNEVISDYKETFVTLRDISNKDIKYYLKNEKDILNVSGFVIETIMSNFIEKIEGSYYNILGVPVETIYKYLNDMGYSLKDLED